MVYIVGRLLRKAELLGAEGSSDSLWKKLMLMPEDYGREAIFDPATRGWMNLMSFEHGGEEYDSRYPEGIPTSLRVEFTNGLKADSGLVMFPSGHARCATADLAGILAEKFSRMSHLSVEDASLAAALPGRLEGIDQASPADLLSLFDIPLAQRASVD
jgi:2-methylcitrate dehydratase